MRIHVRLYGVFRSASKTNELDLELQENSATVGSVLDRLLSREGLGNLKGVLMDVETSDPRPNALIMVSGREISTLMGLETEVADGDELALLPVAHGG